MYNKKVYTKSKIKFYVYLLANKYILSNNYFIILLNN